jgi:tRNA threonylcarbamoyladenosine biosynthesis protein TsaE
LVSFVFLVVNFSLRLPPVAGIRAARYKHAMAARDETVAAQQVELSDLAATAGLAARLARVARAGDVIALHGALGAGKTAFARAFVTACAAARNAAEDEVPSPTFTLMQSYPFDDLVVHHFDLYRIQRPEEVWELGIEDAFADGVTLIEWPERLGALLPADRLDIALLPGARPDARIARLIPHGGWVARLSAALADG